MIAFTATILKFATKGEKTGWTYIEIPADVAQLLKPGNKKSFRVKGKLDHFSIKQIALLPMGDGSFILPLNAPMRKGTGKRQGAMLKVQIEEDLSQLLHDAELTECLNDEPGAKKFFEQLPKSHQNYFSKWIGSAKTVETKANRIAQTINALHKHQNYAEMIRSLKK